MIDVVGEGLLGWPLRLIGDGPLVVTVGWFIDDINHFCLLKLCPVKAKRLLMRCFIMGYAFHKCFIDIHIISIACILDIGSHKSCIVGEHDDLWGLDLLNRVMHMYWFWERMHMDDDLLDMLSLYFLHFGSQNHHLKLISCFFGYFANLNNFWICNIIFWNSCGYLLNKIYV